MYSSMYMYQLMGAFCDRLKLWSTAAPTARLAKTKVDIANKSSHSCSLCWFYGPSMSLLNNFKHYFWIGKLCTTGKFDGYDCSVKTWTIFSSMNIFDFLNLLHSKINAKSMQERHHEFLILCVLPTCIFAHSICRSVTYRSKSSKNSRLEGYGLE